MKTAIIRKKREAITRPSFLDLSQVTFARTDAFLRGAVRSHQKGFLRWQGRENDLLAFGRRAIEIARLAAVEAVPSQTVETDKFDWEKSAQLANNAHKALAALINHLACPSPHYLKGRNPAPADVPVAKLLERRLGFMLPRLRKTRRTKHEGKAGAELLCRTLSVLDGVRTVSNCIRRDHFSSRQNPGTPEKNAFASELMRAWIFITGEKPSSKHTCFADFLSESWGDICESGNGGSWENAVKAAGKTVNSLEIQSIA